MTFGRSAERSGLIDFPWSGLGPGKDVGTEVCSVASYK